MANMDMNDDFGDLEHDFAIAAKWLGIVIAIALVLAWTSAALGAPRAQNALECTIAADMAVVARSLAEESVEPRRAELIMRRIYEVSRSPHGEELMQTILEAAYRERAAAGTFASKLFTACMVTGGNMDGVLGTRL